MAPPKNRRPGFSRKAQYRIFTAYLAAFLGAFAGLLLLVISYLDPTAFSSIRSTAADVTSPVSRGLTSVRDGSGTLGDEIAAYWRAGSKNAEMTRELDAARTRLIEAEALEDENKRLREILELIEDNEPVAIGRIISSTSSSSRRIATFSAGSNQGVKPGQPVRSPHGLVGRVLGTGLNTSSILLVTDTQNVVPVKRARDGTVAFAQGRGDGQVDIQLIDMGLNPFEPGDILVTSGNGGLYRPNIPVAAVVRLTDSGAVADLLSNPAATDFVTIEPIYQPELVERQERESRASDAGVQLP